MKFLTLFLSIPLLFSVKTYASKQGRLTILKSAFDQCNGPKTLTMAQVATLPDDCADLIANLFLQNEKCKAQARLKQDRETRRQQQVSFAWAARTFQPM